MGKVEFLRLDAANFQDIANVLNCIFILGDISRLQKWRNAHMFWSVYVKRLDIHPYNTTLSVRCSSI